MGRSAIICAGPARRPGRGHRERTALDTPVADLRATFARLYADKGIAFAVEVPDGMAVACDGQDVDEMLGNLIDNACRWCRARVRIAASLSERGVTVTVEDDGPGLDADAAAGVLGRGTSGRDSPRPRVRPVDYYGTGRTLWRLAPPRSRDLPWSSRPARLADLTPCVGLNGLPRNGGFTARIL